MSPDMSERERQVEERYRRNYKISKYIKMIIKGDRERKIPIYAELDVLPFCHHNFCRSRAQNDHLSYQRLFKKHISRKHFAYHYTL